MSEITEIINDINTQIKELRIKREILVKSETRKKFEQARMIHYYDNEINKRLRVKERLEIRGYWKWCGDLNYS